MDGDEETEGQKAEEESDDETKSVDSLSRELQYAMAEIANIRSRSLKEKSELIRYASTNLGSKMIDILRSLDLAIESADESAEIAIEGIKMAAEGLRQSLASVGIKPIESDGVIFDPSRMEAIATVPSPDGGAAGVIVEVVERGYMIHDRVLKPAKVIVSE